MLVSLILITGFICLLACIKHGSLEPCAGMYIPQAELQAAKRLVS